MYRYYLPLKKMFNPLPAPPHPPSNHTNTEQMENRLKYGRLSDNCGDNHKFDITIAFLVEK